MVFDRSAERGEMMTRRTLRMRQLVVASVVAAVVAVAVGVPSALITNPLFVRMTPVAWWSYVVWALTAVLSGMLAATYVNHRTTGSATPGRAGLLASVGSVLAVGCPVCNKLVVAAIGVSGALNLWAPIQPAIAFASLALLVWALWRRWAMLRSCPARGDGALLLPVAVAPAAERNG
ncbi:hypothetical protein GCM10010533_28560 [Mycolicibacterium pallens]